MTHSLAFITWRWTFKTWENMVGLKRCIDGHWQEEKRFWELTIFTQTTAPEALHTFSNARGKIGEGEEVEKRVAREGKDVEVASS